MTAAGDLNRRLTLEAPLEVDDGAGGVTVSYQAVAILWAQLTPISARGAVDADRLAATVTHRIVMRRRADVTARHRLRDGATIYRIVALRESADRRFLLIDGEQHRD